MATTNGAALVAASTAEAAPVAVLSAKLAPPPLAHATVLRKRPLALLSRAVQRLPLTLISGPAGSGKTVLAACWMAAEAPGRPIAWLTLDDYDDEPSVFWSYVVAALDRAGVALPGVPRLVRGESPPRGLLSSLAAAVTARSQPIVLVIDNADHVSSRGIITALDLLVRNAGSKLRLVLCARADPQLPLHQYRLAGSMAEIRGDQLAFTAEETRDLMAATGVPVTAEVAARLCAETQGWAVGLRLAAAPVKQGASPERLATSLAHDDGTVAQYLFAEVLAGQPAGVRRLLLRISVAEELEAGLVDRLAGRPGSRRVLVALARANAFVEESPGAPGGFRIHPLFREMLHAQLAYDHPGEVAGLHRTCAAWYSEAGRTAEAIEQAITARDWAFASRLLVDDLVVPRLLAHGDDPLLRGRPLPPDFGGVDGAVLRAALAVAAGDGPSAADLAAAAAAVHAGDRPSLRASAALACLAAATLAESDPAHILALADAAQAAWTTPGEEEDRPERREISALVAGARAQAMVRSDEAAQEAATHLRAAAGAAHVAGAGRLRCRAVAMLAVLECFDGQLTRAAQHATEAEALYADAGTDEHDRLVASAAALALVHLQRYALSDAQEWLGRALSRERRGPGAPDGTLSSALVALVQAQSLRVRRQYDTAEDCLQTVLGQRELPRWLRERAVLESARLDFAQGRPAEGVALLDDPAVDGDRRTPLRALARLLGDEAPVALLAAEEPGGAPVDVLEHRILRACQLAEAGAVPAAVAELERALDVGRSELHRLPFLDAPPQGRRLLRMHPRLQDPSRWLSPSSAAAPRPRAAAAAPVAPAQQLTQDLSDRETEVLRHLAQMLSTAEIAATMFISVNTVRTHIRSILRKLGVSRRNQAVRRAREHGLL